MTPLDAPLSIGPVVARNRVWLAPMSGISDVVFRRLADEAGAGLVFTEMVASEAWLEDHGETALRARPAGGIHAVQLAGCEPDAMARAAERAEAEGADLLDINMGCPAKRVTGGMAGAALMRDMASARRIIEDVVRAVGIPVTVKMRLGWDAASRNAPALAAMAQDCGAAAITVHGRTREQFYKGSADWSAVAEVRAATDLPLIVNGDIVDRGSAEDALRQSGADAVMVGRASCGAPWLPGVIAGRSMPGAPARRQLALAHLDGLLDLHGPAAGLRLARKHMSWVLERERTGEATERRALLTSEDAGAARSMFEAMLGDGRQLAHAA